MSGQPHDAVLHDYNGEWAEADFTQAKPGEGAASPVAGSSRGEHAAAKLAVSIRLSRDIVDHFRAAGPGWEARIEETLRRTVEAERLSAKQGAGATQPRHEFVSDGHEG
jgi:uncharacterized protein (DUF4415 family)